MTAQNILRHLSEKAPDQDAFYEKYETLKQQQ
jgi:hypothetical protein